MKTFKELREESQLVNVHPQSSPWGAGQKRKRVKYRDSEGNEFSGLHDDAVNHFRKLHPSKSIKIHNEPKK